MQNKIPNAVTVAMTSPVPRSDYWQWVDAIRQIKCAHGPNNGLPGHRLDVERVSGLPEEVRAAARLLARHRSRSPRRPDALNRVIAGYLAELPDITPAEIWADLLRIAEGGGDGVLIESNPDSGLLSWVAEPGGPVRDIGFEALRRRVQRLRKSVPLLPNR
mgnify:CR=1 FL=1